MSTAWTVNKTRATKRIDGPNGEFIIVQKMNQKDKDDVNDIMSGMDLQGKDKEQIAKMNLGSMRRLQRIRSVKDWNLKDEEGNPAPLTEESICNLPDEVIAEIDEAIEELNPVVSPEKKKG